jgi:hypothetical protein
MADLSTTKSVASQEILARLDLVKHNPSAINQTILEMLDEVSDAQVNIVDPTTPFMFLLTSTCMNTALVINEFEAVCRKLYPTLAQTDDELYANMSDKDFLNRFSSPSDAVFTIVVNAVDVQQKMLWSEADQAYKATIPRNTRFMVDGFSFMLEYPINFYRFVNGTVQVTYDNSIESPISSLQSNILNYVVRNDKDGVPWIFFQVNLKQFDISSTTIPLQKSKYLTQSIQYSDQYYFIRVYYENTVGGVGVWQEMKTTHSDQIFDPLTPTALIQVNEGAVIVRIPPVYLMSGQISGQIKVDVHTTKGELALNLSNYKVESFSMSYTAIDDVRDLNDYTAQMRELSHYSFSSEIVTGGTNGLDFSALRDRVIFNSTGPQQLPITDKNMSAYVENLGFSLVENVDAVTDRVFLATQKLPKPINVKLATSANIGISTFISNLEYLRSLDYVADNGSQVTLLSKNLYKNVNGVVSILTSQEIQTILLMQKTAMVNHINSMQYLYSPFYYVLDDTGQEFAVRAYNLDYPFASNLSFVSQNQTLQLASNTGSYVMSKIDTGFRLTMTTVSGQNYKTISDDLVDVQLAYYPVGESKMAYINGVLVSKTDTGERTYTFDIETNYAVNDKDQITITNARMFGNEALDTLLSLEAQFHILYTTSSVTTGYVPDEMADLIGDFLLPVNSVGVTHETLDIQVGSALGSLWARSRSFAVGLVYKKYTVDFPWQYTEKVYKTDPISGSPVQIVNGEVVMEVLHEVGDPVLDDQGNQTYKYRAGDVMLDENGDPILDNDMSINKEIDMLFVDGRHYFVTDEAFRSYNDELVGVLDTWITQDVESIQDVLLEKTRIYFYPKTTLGQVKVYTEDSGQNFVNSEQSLVLDLYVGADVYNDNDIRQQLIDLSVKLLDESISESVVNTTAITLALNEAYAGSVKTLQLSGLGGMENDYKIVTLAAEENRLCLKKILAIQSDGSLIIKEDVTVNFFKVPT